MFHDSEGKIPDLVQRSHAKSSSHLKVKQSNVFCALKFKLSLGYHNMTSPLNASSLAKLSHRLAVAIYMSSLLSLLLLCHRWLCLRLLHLRG